MLHEELKRKGSVSAYEYVDLLKAEYLNPEQLKKFQQEETIRRKQIRDETIKALTLKGELDLQAAINKLKKGKPVKFLVHQIIPIECKLAEDGKIHVMCFGVFKDIGIAEKNRRISSALFHLDELIG